MPSKSRSNRRRKRKSKFVSEPKQERRVKQPTRSWSDLPSDLMLNILQRVDVYVLENAQRVCTAWREICKDPAMWRVICMDKVPRPRERCARQKMCKLAVGRSQGQLVDLTMIGFCNHELLMYVANRSSQLRRLEIKYMFGDNCVIWGEAFKKLSLLEELSLGSTSITDEVIAAVGQYCPLLKTLKVNLEAIDDDIDDIAYFDDGDALGFMFVQTLNALAIGKYLPWLAHLELIGSAMTNVGLMAILDGCSHLKSLDLRRCYNLDLQGDLGKRCSQQIKYLKLPNDSLEGFPHIFKTYDVLTDSDFEYPNKDDENFM